MEDDQVPFSVLGLAGQTADLQRWGIVGDTEMVKIEADGTLVMDGAELPAPKYPVFVFEVPYGAPWTDFELKASRTNFGADGSPDMVFYYHSPGSTGTEIGDHPDVWFTDSGTDPREWHRLTESPRTSIADSLTDANSQVGGIVVVVTDPAVAAAAADPTLIWSYAWMDATTRDEDPANRPVWRPAIPIWVPATFTPSTHQPN
jgi:hypothetical protein